MRSSLTFHFFLTPLVLFWFFKLFFLQKLHYRLAREIYTSSVALPWFRRLSRLLK